MPYSHLESLIYLDWNATTPPAPEVLEAMREAAAGAWGNPASLHGSGRRARALVEDARAAVGALLGADVRDVLMTSGGTEANNLALRSAFASSTRPDDVLVTSRLEHPSIVRVAEALAAEGRAQVHWLRVEPGGRVDLEDLVGVLSASPVRLVALGAVNHETGVVQPVREAIELAARSGVAVHVDAVQSLGKVDVPLDGAATVSVAAHKIRGPKGIGALVGRPGVALAPILLGGAQERGLRPGTQDPVAAAGFAAAARRALEGVPRYRAVEALRDHLEQGLRAAGATVHGQAPGVQRAPHVLNVAVPGWDGPELVAALDLEGICVSSGSACSAGTPEPSPVITAMAGAQQARRAVRFSLGDGTAPGDIDAALAALDRILARARRPRVP